MRMELEHYLLTSREFLSKLTKELENGDSTKSTIRTLKAVFTVLRRRLSIEESFDLVSQLPYLLKAMYVDGWKPGADTKKIKNDSEFIVEVLNTDQLNKQRDFGTPQEVERRVRAVFKVIQEHVSSGEIEDIKSCMPQAMRGLLQA